MLRCCHDSARAMWLPMLFVWSSDVIWPLSFPGTLDCVVGADSGNELVCTHSTVRRGDPLEHSTVCSMCRPCPSLAWLLLWALVHPSPPLRVPFLMFSHWFDSFLFCKFCTGFSSCDHWVLPLIFLLIASTLSEISHVPLDTNDYS